MASRLNKGFTLLEVLMTVAILATAIVVVFRSYVTVLSAVGFSQNMALACFLSEEKMGEIEQSYTNDIETPQTGSQRLANTNFNWRYEIAESAIPELKELRFTVSWKESARDKVYPLSFFEYLPSRQK